MKLNQLQNTQVTISTKINRTENMEKVKNSLRNITTNDQEITIIKTDNNKKIEISGDINILSTIKKRIKSQEYTLLARNIFERNKTENNLIFYVNKQSACNNNFHMIDENISSLDDIKVEISTENMDDVIDYLLS